MDELTGTLLVVATGVFWVWFYLWMRRKFSYWSSRGVVHPPVVPIFGNSLRLFSLGAGLGDYFKSLYEAFPDRDYVGYYGFTMPHLVVRSPKLIEKILIKDFGHFVDHGLEIDEEKNWIDMSLFNLTGNRWRAVRNKITPAFTTGKLKLMMEQMVACGDNLVRYLNDKGGSEVDVRDLMSAYSTEVVASVAFGLEITDWEKTREFRKMGKKVLDMDLPRYIGFLCLLNLPWLGHALNGRLTPKDVSDYFSGLIVNNFEHRLNNKVRRNDFVQLLLDLKEKGSVDFVTKDPDDDYLGFSDLGSVQSFEMTDKMLIAQAFTFIMAGFDAMSSSITFVAWELAKHPEIQQAVRKEVHEVRDRHGAFTYQAIKDMTYVDQCIHETLRIHPLVAFVLRICTKTYKLDDGLTVEEGTRLIVPLLGLQTDPQYYPDPLVFNPDRFGPNATKIPFTYLPFGEGPRMCIGMRFAMLQMKYALVRMINEFEILLSPVNPTKMELKIQTVITMPKNPLWLNFKKIP